MSHGFWTKLFFSIFMGVGFDIGTMEKVAILAIFAWALMIVITIDECLDTYFKEKEDEKKYTH